MRWINAFAGTVLVAVPGIYSQTASAPTFEVASVKPTELPAGFVPIGSRTGIQISGNRVTMGQVNLLGLVMEAYDLKAFQVVGAVGFTDKLGRQQFYDIAAKTEGEDTPTIGQVRQMLQTLLSDRFNMKVHREMRDLPVYDLEIGKNGSKLKESVITSQGSNGPVGQSGFRQSGPLWRFKLSNLSMADIAKILANNVDRPVLGKTGLTGRYDFALEFLHGNPEMVAPDSPDADKSIFTAVQEQLGLKLVAAKQPTEILVIDRADKPSEN